MPGIKITTVMVDHKDNNDTVSKPAVLTASVIQAIGEGAVADAWFEAARFLPKLKI